MTNHEILRKLSSIIVLSFDHRVCFFNEYPGSEAICHFHARAIARRRKAWFHLRMSRVLFAAKHFKPNTSTAKNVYPCSAKNDT